MYFHSTRDRALKVSLRDAIFQGLAPDGGLYQPSAIPDLRGVFESADAGTPFVDLAAGMLSALFPEEFDGKKAKDLCARAFPFQPALRRINPTLHLLELFHGPSCAFKDFGASFLASLMEHYLSGSKDRALILTATSGDTGSAVAQAFHQKAGIDVVILYPSGLVSPSQEMQLTTVGDNVHALEVQGTFDDCQRMVKDAFNDEGLRAALPLTSANSINLGRLIPQSFYYAWAYEQLKAIVPGPIHFCVPSGNFGNLTAGVMAWQWGLPVGAFVAATNANDVVPEYLGGRTFTPRPSVHTYSNAMDVGNPSNFERLQAIFDANQASMRALIWPEVVSDRDTAAAMKRYYDESGLFLCPHTAVGLVASERFQRDSAGAGNSGSEAKNGPFSAPTVVSLATADPGKFTEVVKEATGMQPPVPERLAAYMRRKKSSTVIGKNFGDLRAYLSKSF